MVSAKDLLMVELNINVSIQTGGYHVIYNPRFDATLVNKTILNEFDIINDDESTCKSLYLEGNLGLSHIVHLHIVLLLFLLLLRFLFYLVLIHITALYMLFLSLFFALLCSLLSHYVYLVFRLFLVLCFLLFVLALSFCKYTIHSRYWV